MLISSKLTKQDFINVTFVLLYNKTSIKIFTGIIGLFFILTTMTYFMVPRVSISQIIIPFLLLVFLPLMTYFQALQNFSSNKRISEIVEYEFGVESLLIRGQSFVSELSLEKIYKVTKTRNWLLIWQTRQTANAIPNRDISSGQMKTLKDILERHNIKNNV